MAVLTVLRRRPTVLTGIGIVVAFGLGAARSYLTVHRHVRDAVGQVQEPDFRLLGSARLLVDPTVVVLRIFAEKEGATPAKAWLAVAEFASAASVRGEKIKLVRLARGFRTVYTIPGEDFLRFGMDYRIDPRVIGVSMSMPGLLRAPDGGLDSDMLSADLGGYAERARGSSRALARWQGSTE